MPRNFSDLFSGIFNAEPEQNGAPAMAEDPGFLEGLLKSLSGIQFKPTPASMGLLQAGAKMLQNSGPSPVPVSFGQQLGTGVEGFAQGYGTQQNLAGTAELRKIQALKAIIDQKNALRTEREATPEGVRDKKLAEAAAEAEARKTYPDNFATPLPWYTAWKEKPTPENPRGVMMSPRFVREDLNEGDLSAVDVMAAMNAATKGMPGYGEEERLKIARLEAAERLRRQAEEDRRAQENADRDKVRFEERGMSPLPATVVKAYKATMKNEIAVDYALKMLEENPNAVGTSRRFLPSLGLEGVQQKLDVARDTEGEIRTRTTIENLGKLTRFDVTGKAEGKFEDSDFKKWVPKSDSEYGINHANLLELKRAIQEEKKLFESIYRKPYFKNSLIEELGKEENDEDKGNQDASNSGESHPPEKYQDLTTEELRKRTNRVTP